MPAYVGDIPLGTLSGLSGDTSSQMSPDVQKVMELMKLLQQVSPPPQEPQPMPGMLKYSDNPWANLFQSFGRGFQNTFGTQGMRDKFTDAAMKRKIYMDQMAGYQDRQAQYEAGQDQFKREALLEDLRQSMQGQNQQAVANIRATQPTRAQRLQKSEWVDNRGHRIRQFTDPFDGSIQPVVDPNTGELVDQMDLGPALVTPFIQPAVPGVSGPQRISRLGPEGPVGGGVTPPPPPNIVNSLAMDKVSLEAIGNMKSAYRLIRQQTGGQTRIGKAAREKVGSTRYGGMFAETEPYASYRSTMANSLNAYVKAQTGAQFSIKEMDRYAALYPEAWDPEKLADTKIENLKQRALADMKEKLRNYPAANEPAQSNSVDDILNEWDAQHAQTP